MVYLLTLFSHVWGSAFDLMPPSNYCNEDNGVHGVCCMMNKKLGKKIW